MSLALDLVNLVMTIALVPFFGLLALIVAANLVGPGSRPRVRAEGLRATASRFLIVIPAHDELGVIGDTVRSCLALDYDRDLFSVHVIADNCTDGTADEARTAGALVSERFDPHLKSKGHALEHFFTTTPAGQGSLGDDAVVLIDADTLVDPGLLKAFDHDLHQGQDWIQGYYSVSNPDASWRTRMMTYAFSLANGVWLRGLDRLGLSVGLKGNGMCFSRKGLRRAPWKAHGLVEDMEFAWTLRLAGERVRFDQEARVYGQMVSRAGAGAVSQRQRWERGRQSLRTRFAQPVAFCTNLSLAARFLSLIELFFPPLGTLASILIMVLTIDLILTVNSSLFRLGTTLAISHLVGVGLFSLYGVSPLWAVRLPARYLASLLALPYYLLWKLGVSLRRSPKSWVRTPREVHPQDREDPQSPSDCQAMPN